MSKVNLVPITGAQNVSAINDNFQKVAEALNDKVLYRGNPRNEPNQMGNDLDMNEKRIYNLPEPVLDHEPVRKKEFGDVKKSLRVGDRELPPLPSVAERRNKLVSFDSEGNPEVRLPSTDSATELRYDLTTFTGNISADAEWSDVPAHSDPAFDVQAQALVNRTEWVSKRLNVRTPEDFGAPESGDCTLAFQRALDWMGESPLNKLVDGFVGTRVFEGTLSATSHVNWDSGVAQYVARADLLLRANGNSGAVAHAITADYVKGSLEISVNLPRAPKVGEWIRIVSNAVNPADRGRIGFSNKYRIQEFAQVGVGSTATKVILSSPLRFDIGVNDAEDTVIDAYTISNNARVALVDTSKQFVLAGGTWTHEDGRATSGSFIEVIGYYFPMIYRPKTGACYGANINLVGTLFAQVVEPSVGFAADTGSINGYGVCDGGYFTKVSTGVFNHCRHGYTTLQRSLASNTQSIFSGGNTVGGVVEGCVSFGCTSSAFDTHAGTYDITFKGCKAYGGGVAFANRGINTLITDCRSVLTAQSLWTFVGDEGGSFIAGKLPDFVPTVVVENSDLDGTGGSGLDGGIGVRLSKVVIRNSTIRSAVWRMLRVASGEVTLEGNVTFEATTFGGKLPLRGSDASNLIIATNYAEGSVFFPNRSFVKIADGASVNIVLDAFESLPSSIIQVPSGFDYYQDGSITIKAKAPSVRVTGSWNGATLVNPNASIKFIVPQDTSVALGMLEGRVKTYDASGSYRPDSNVYRGASGTLTYEKRDTGQLTVTNRLSFSVEASQWTAAGSLFYFVVGGFDYPIAFSGDQPTITASTAHQRVIASTPLNSGTATSSPSFRVWVASSEALGTVNLRVVAEGRWK